jgi:hypothetical protein
MLKPLLLAVMLVLAPMSPAVAAEDDYGLGEDAPPTMKLPSEAELKGLKVTPGASLGASGLGDMAQAMRLIKIGQALKARKPVSAEDITYLRTTLKKMGKGDPGNSTAAQMQKLDQVLDQLQRRTEAPNEMDEMMKDFADGADMDDMPKLDD